ncbi:hypothetical protein BC937DRAFT_91204 [Endogone sp. FLAS-F59071]|nr:hypothetical protein BC937DRAFT_91204 [Endogone sp. FLAS-F59071]|eukprot:RUS21882.1 hypothetical protein BC937DRAFT_91204 [Endogone sp. FLAS-F59071]
MCASRLSLVEATNDATLPRAGLTKAGMIVSRKNFEASRTTPSCWCNFSAFSPSTSLTPVNASELKSQPSRRSDSPQFSAPALAPSLPSSLPSLPSSPPSLPSLPHPQLHLSRSLCAPPPLP